MAKKVDLPEPIIPNDSWKVVKLGQYVKILNGYPFDSSRFTNSNENTYPLIRIRDVVRGYTETFTDEDCPDEYKIKKGEILIGMDGDFNISRWKSDFGLLNQRVCKISTVSKDLDEKFLFYYLPIPLKLINDATPSVTVKHLSSTSFQELHFPLPTLAEQQRIVKRIESMFAKLGEAKEKAQNVVDGFETRKAAILHKAFTGELKIENEKLKEEDWEETTLSECCKLGSGGTPSKSHPEYYENGDIPWLKTGEIDWNDIYDAEEKITDDGVANSSAKMFPAESVVVAMYGMGVTRGRAAIIKKPMTTNQAVCVLQPKEKLYNKFLFYYFMCNYHKIREQSVGGNQLNLSGKIIGNFPIKLPPFNFQLSIVNFLDIIIEKENKAKQAAEAVLEQIDLLKKSILARAFRGEL
ncbi:MAG: restriction endonuclease subunit S [Spirochaetaceae bacterium]|nr:restriction endonuclease subunit S [Spirochaetaceae bacterium]